MSGKSAMILRCMPKNLGFLFHICHIFLILFVFEVHDVGEFEPNMKAPLSFLSKLFVQFSSQQAWYNALG